MTLAQEIFVGLIAVRMVEYQNGVFDGDKNMQPANVITTTEDQELARRQAQLVEKAKKLDIDKYRKPL